MLKLLNVIALYKYYVVKVQIAISFKKNLFSLDTAKPPYPTLQNPNSPYKTDQVSVSPIYLHTLLCKSHFIFVNNYVSNFVCILIS